MDSLKFKANQILESINALQRTVIDAAVPPSWPDILSKYNIILSQTHNFSSALAATRPNHLESIALHPHLPMSDTQLDNDLIPLLRNQQTTDVLRLENNTVRRIAERMTTRGSLAVLARSDTSDAPQAGKATEYEDVLRECDQIRNEHDRRVERAVRAVTMLRDKFDWKQRVEVEVEEPEELGWDPRAVARTAARSTDGVDIDADADAEGDVGMDSPDQEGGQSSDEDEVEGELVDDAAGGTEPSTPMQGVLPDASGVPPTVTQ